MRKYALLGTILAATVIAACGDDETTTTTTTTTTTSGTTTTTSTSGTGGAGGSTSSAGGAGGTGGTGGVGGAGNCTALNVAALTLSSNGIMIADVSVEGPDPDFFQIEFYELNDIQMTGTFDLAASPDDNYETCDRCVLVYADNTDTGTGKYFFQESGAMQLDFVTSPPGTSPASAGSLANVKLIEVTIDPQTYESTPVANGACLTLDALAWDFTPVEGTPCEAAEECGNPVTQVCDVTSETCVAGQCDGNTLNCAATELCLAQVEDPLVGACYTQCTPFTVDACANGFECVNLSLDNLTGVCYQTGLGATASDCAIVDTTTACVAGDVCALGNGAQSTCHQQCTIFAADPGCPAATDCTYNSLCVDATGTDPAAIDGLCDAAAAFAAPCGPSAGAYRGLCFNDVDGDPLVCGQLCRLAPGFDTDCPVAQYCSDAFGQDLGVCRNDPVCGNGTVEEGEECDDSNTTPGDGCDAACVEELAFYCANPLTAILGDNMGDTSDGSSVITSTCTSGDANKEKIYTFTPALTGTLTLTLASATDQGLNVRDACDDDTTEVSCVDIEVGGTDEVLDVQVTAGTPITIIVDGYSSFGDAGPYILTLALN
jgi:cysteine-rich repeat protein